MAVPQIEVKVSGSERTKKTFIELARRIDDMTPVWEDFADYYKDDLMKTSWQSKGALMEGSRWSPLTEQYRKWKAKSGGSKELMKLTGKLFNAATGGAGWKQRVSKDNLVMGVEGEAYYYWVQHRQKNGRFYFYTKDEDLPKRAWAKLVKLADEYLEGADDK